MDSHGGQGFARGSAGHCVQRVVAIATTLATFLLLGLLTIYRRGVSPLMPRCCKFYPSCSEYAVTAIKHHGPLAGVGLSIRRLGRCHPFSDGGYDPVPGTPNILVDMAASQRGEHPAATSEPSLPIQKDIA